MAIRNDRGRPAYFLVDLSELSDVAQQQVLEEVMMGGGGDSGVRVVEEVYNGPIVQPIYGVYYGQDEKRWNEFRQADSTSDDAGETDEEREERLRAAAARTAEEQAEETRAAEEAEIRRIVEGDNADATKQAATNKNKNR